MRKTWYARLGDQTFGPLGMQELIAMAADGRLQPNDSVRCEETGGWLPAAQVKEIRFPTRVGAGVVPPHSAGDQLPRIEPNALPSTGADAPEEFLDDLEDLMIRMIKGNFIVFFVKFPQKLWRLATRMFPKVVKVVRIFILSWVWLIIGFGPAIWLYWTAGVLPIELPPSISEHRELIRLTIVVVVGCWTAIAGVFGSIYGIGFIKDRRRRKAAAAAARIAADSATTTVAV
ncbi:MAG: DUF4339 domain-containing protein [Planctomycetales bacterium]|nr:DUF4339 domain-containing protein [Planctomycetales bacterium]MBN8624924.1 DUF4339 domain-containing protein [Planctomycetota bacterium]